MKETINDVQESIRSINDTLCTLYGEEFFIYNLTMLSDGLYCYIKFLNQQIWSEEEDDREFIEEINDYEDLENYLRKRVNEVCNEVAKIRV